MVCVFGGARRWYEFDRSGGARWRDSVRLSETYECV